MCWKLSRVVGSGFEHLAFEAYGFGRTGKAHAHILVRLAGDGTTEVILHKPDQSVTVGDFPRLDALGQCLFQNGQFAGIALSVHLAPEAVDPHTHRLFQYLRPAMFMVGDSGKKRHRFNRLLSRGMWVELLTSQRFSTGGITPKEGHRNDEMDMERA